MRKILNVIMCLFATVIIAKAQVQDSPTTMKVYCEVMCVQYNLFKGDVNAVVDFGIADKAKNADGWIYDSETNKKMSFASPMSVFSYMAKRGWEYKDAIIITEINGMKGKQNVWHFILTKEMPLDCTPEDIVGNIDYRNK
ncbi:MAG: hypothetical protein K2M07_01890 [Muribaculaceae bacterium]|nr:hypothetical protein [Muribaculaceae bacterium]